VKKLSFLLIVLIICFTSFALCEEDSSNKGDYSSGYDAGYDDGYTEGRNSLKSRTPVVKVIQPDEIPEIEPGEELVYKINYINDSKDSAVNLTITPEFGEDKVLVYERPLKYSTISSLRSKKEGSCTFRIKTELNAKKGTYPLKLKLEYKNTNGDVFNRDEVVYFKIKSEKSKPIINIENIFNSADVINYGDKFSIRFDVLNIGEGEAKEVEVKLQGFDNNTIMPVGSKDFAYIDTIEAKRSATLTFDFQVSEEIATRDNSITVNVKYKGFDDKDYTIEKNIYVTGVNLKPKKEDEKKEDDKKEEPKLAKPKMIISSYGVSPNTIVAGDEFTFSFYFKNTSKDKAIRNIKATVSSKEGAFIITKGSNTFYIEKMGAQERVYKQIDLKAKQDLTSNSYEIHIDFDYEDYDGAEYQSTEIINIPVTEYSKLIINSAYVGETYLDNPTSLSFDYVNMGKATISNLQATVTGDYEPLQDAYYIGNVQAGTSDYFDLEIKPTKEGLNSGTLVLTFEDSSGRPIVVTRDFSGQVVEVVEEPIDIGPIGPNEMPGEETSNTFSVWTIVLSGVGTFLVLLVITKYITKKIILKKFEKDI
jgi:hypothetical protein